MILITDYLVWPETEYISGFFVTREYQRFHVAVDFWADIRLVDAAPA